MKKLSTIVVCTGLLGCVGTNSIDRDSDTSYTPNYTSISPVTTSRVTKIQTLNDKDHKNIFNGCVYQDFQQKTLNFVKSDKSGTGWQVDMKTGNVIEIANQPVLDINDICDQSNHGVMSWSRAGENEILKIFNPAKKETIAIDFNKLNSLNEDLKNINKDNSWFGINEKNNILIYNILESENIESKKTKYTYKMVEINVNKDPMEIENIDKDKLSFTPAATLKDIVYIGDHNILVVDKDKKNEFNFFYHSRYWRKLTFSTYQDKNPINYDIDQILTLGDAAVIYEKKSSSVFVCRPLMIGGTSYFEGCYSVADFSKTNYSLDSLLATDGVLTKGRIYFYGTDNTDGSTGIFQIKV